MESEYERLTADTAPVLDGAKFADLQTPDIDFLTQETGWGAAAETFLSAALAVLAWLRGMAASLAESVAALAPVYRIKPGIEHVEPLLSDGLDSASEVARKSAKNFVMLFFASAVIILAYFRRRHRHHRA
jgi:hypothetical protein